MKYPNLRWAIRRRGFSDRDVAARLKLHPSQFSRRLTGQVAFAPLERELLAKILGFPLAWLFYEPFSRRIEEEDAKLTGDSGLRW